MKFILGRAMFTQKKVNISPWQLGLERLLLIPLKTVLLFDGWRRSDEDDVIKCM